MSLPAPAARSTLSRLALVGRNVISAAARDPLAHQRWTPPQDAWLRLVPRHHVKLLRGGNQAIGKTTAGLAEVDWRATGRHPYRKTRVPPVEIWVVCTSWSQSVAVQRKFWSVVSKSQLTTFSRDQFSHRRGWGKDNPVVEYLNGSIVRFRTTGQGPEAFAGASIDYALVDEPTEEEIFRELLKRVMRQGGEIGIVLTPVNRDCTWLRKLVDAGMIDEVHARLEVANLIPIGSKEPLRLLDGTPMDQAWIDEQRLITPAMWAPVVLDGEWDLRPQGVFFKPFDAKKHVRANVKLDPRRGPIRVVLGFDYAAADRPYGHCAALTLVQEQPHEGRTRYAVYGIDEVVMAGTDTTAAFVRAVLAMLSRNGYRWTDLFAVHGDNPVTSRFAERSNLLTAKALAVELGIPLEALQPRVLSAKDGGQSSEAYNAGNRWIYARIASNEFLLHPRCEATIRGYEQWDYTKTHDSKDVLDARRYSLKPFIFPSAGMSDVTIHLH